jgi:hypothetical protein
MHRFCQTASWLCGSAAIAFLVVGSLLFFVDSANAQGGVGNPLGYGNGCTGCNAYCAQFGNPNSVPLVCKDTTLNPPVTPPCKLPTPPGGNNTTTCLAACTCILITPGQGQLPYCACWIQK